MSNVDFSEYLSKPVGEMKRTLLPPGHYHATVKDWETKESGKGKPMLVINFALVAAGEDVDQTQLPENGVSSKRLSNFYMLAEDFGQDDIRKTLEATGQEMDDAAPFGQYLDPAKGLPVLLLVGSRRREKDDPTSELMDSIEKVLPAA